MFAALQLRGGKSFNTKDLPSSRLFISGITLVAGQSADLFFKKLNVSICIAKLKKNRLQHTIVELACSKEDELQIYVKGGVVHVVGVYQFSDQELVQIRQKMQVPSEVLKGKNMILPESNMQASPKQGNVKAVTSQGKREQRSQLPRTKLQGEQKDKGERVRVQQVQKKKGQNKTILERARQMQQFQLDDDIQQKPLRKIKN